VVTGSTAILAASDIQATVKFYTDVLGFQSSWTWGEPPSFGGASWGAVSLMFNLEPELASRIEGHQHWLDVEDVDSLYEQHRARGATIVSAIEDKPWGKREYTVRDPNGYHLRFAGNPGYTPRGIQGSAEGVDIVCRMPTSEEFERVAGPEFYKDGVPAGLLERSWGGVIATSPDGEVIGTTRIMYDAGGWFSLWDVVIVPDWQGRRIGTAMVEAAMDIVRSESPGAFLYLFTFKDGFYERLGFAKQSLHLVKV
jgi:catechol 2,3-dioxygenase-like lactoylglutathione lyase family enzyme